MTNELKAIAIEKLVFHYSDKYGYRKYKGEKEWFAYLDGMKTLIEEEDWKEIIAEVKKQTVE